MHRKCKNEKTKNIVLLRNPIRRELCSWKCKKFIFAADLEFRRRQKVFYEEWKTDFLHLLTHQNHKISDSAWHFFIIWGAVSPKSETCETEPNAQKKKAKKQCFFSKFIRNGFLIVIWVKRVLCLLQPVYFCNDLHNLCKLKMNV